MTVRRSNNIDNNNINTNQSILSSIIQPISPVSRSSSDISTISTLSNDSSNTDIIDNTISQDIFDEQQRKQYNDTVNNNNNNNNMHIPYYHIDSHTNYHHHQSQYQYNDNDLITPHYINQWLDVYNTHKKHWLEAQIKDINHNHNMIYIHYKGLSDNYNQWLPLNDDIHNMNRIAALHTHTQPRINNAQYNTIIYNINDDVDVLDEYDRWCLGHIIDIDNNYSLYCISYTDSHKQVCDEWLNVNTYRITRPRTYSNKKHQQQQNDTVINVRYNNDNNNQHTHQSLQARHKSYDEGYTQRSEKELRFRSMLQQHLNYDIIEVGSDGNCLFRSVSHQLYGTEIYHNIIRHYCIEYIKLEQQYFKNFITESFDIYIQHMSQDGCWGDHVEIQAISELYNRPVEIYAYSIQPLRTFNINDIGQHNQHHNVIRLSYHFNSHYNSVIDLNNQHSNAQYTQPGIIEERSLEHARIRNQPQRAAVSAQQHNNTTQISSQQQSSDILSTDQSYLQHTLQLSRQQFESSNMNDYNRAIAESVQQLNNQTDSAIAAAQTESIREYELQQQTQQAIELSMQNNINNNSTINNNNNTTTAMTHSNSNLEEQNIARVLAESLKDTNNNNITTNQHNNHNNNNNTVNGTTPKPIQRCMELGFTFDQCSEAYIIFNDSNQSIDTITQNMTAYLLGN